MGPVAKQVKKRVGTLSVKLHELFRQYIASGKIPSVQSLKKAKFKFRPGKCYAYGLLKRRSRIRVVSVSACSDGDKLCPKVYAEGFVLERFRAWAKRMKVNEEGRLLFVGNDKIIIPKEHFSDLVRKVHMKDGASGLKHRSFVKTLKLLRKVYSIGRRQFGVSPQFIKKIVQSCTDEKCSAKQYKLRRNRGMLTDGVLSAESPRHSSESDNSLLKSHGDDDASTDTDLNIDVVSVENLCDSGSDVQNPTGDNWKQDDVTSAGGEPLSDFYNELINLAPKCSRVLEHEADCGFGSDKSLAVMFNSEQLMRDNAPQQTPPGKPFSQVAAHQDKIPHSLDDKSTKKTPNIHKVCAPVWTPPAPQTSLAAHTKADRKSPKKMNINCCKTSPKLHGSTLEPMTQSPQRTVGKNGSKEKVQSTGKSCKGGSWEYSAGLVQTIKPSPVENTMFGLDNQQDRKKTAGAVVMTTHTKKFAHLLDVIRQMKIDIGPACANNQMALERLKRSQLHEIQRKLFDCFIVENKEIEIHIGLSVLSECCCLLQKYEETQCSVTSHFK